MMQNVEIIHQPGVDGVIVRLTTEFEISGTEWSERKANNEYRLLAPDAIHTLTEKDIDEIDTYI